METDGLKNTPCMNFCKVKNMNQQNQGLLRKVQDFFQDTEVMVVPI